MHEDRLKHLTTVLKGVPDYRLRMSLWRNETRGCGTVACAAGWATLDPWFQSLGLSSEHINGEPIYKNHHGYYALCQFFGLSLEATFCLFSDATYSHTDYPNGVKPQNVIDRVVELLTEDLR